MTHVPQQRRSTLARVHDSSQSVVLPTEQCGLFSSNLTQERRLQHTQGLSTQFTKGQPSQGFSTPLTQASSPQLNGPTFANTDYAYSARGHMHTSLVPHKQQAHTNFNLDMSQATAYQASYSADWVTQTCLTPQCIHLLICHTRDIYILLICHICLWPVFQWRGRRY